jgi:polysaccharide export outer membrane protein
MKMLKTQTINLRLFAKIIPQLIALIAISTMLGCSATPSQIVTQPGDGSNKPQFDYTLGPGDVIDVFVWRNEDLTVQGVPVRPDGKISTPLVEDMTASGQTPKELARNIERQLAKYIKDPFVTVTVREFRGRLTDQIRVVGEAAEPQSLPYSENITLLDVMIVVGGLTEFAAGDRASVVRVVNGKQINIPVKLNSLLKDGDINANIAMYPGDILIIPESWF